MKTLTLALMLATTLVSVSFAHDTWIVCTPPVIKSGAMVSLHATTGTAFPKYDAAPEASRIQSCEWRIGGRQGSLSEFKQGTGSLVVSGRVTTDGVAVIYTEFQPNEIDLTPEEVDEYMDEIGAPEGVRRAWKDSGDDTFHETYRKHAKTYLRVGESGDAEGCLGPVGFNVDFLLDRDPTTLKVGDALTVKVIRGGDELEGFSVGAVRANGKATMERTSKSGMVSIAIDTPGWWLIRGTELRRKTDGTWESDFTTLTFFVQDE